MSNDDELIRDAVHELVNAAPAPKPLPMGGAPGGARYRWLAIAAAVVLVVGGILAIAWSQADDDDATPVATTQATPPPTAPDSVPTSVPATTSPVTATVAPPTAPTTVETTSTTTSTSTTSTTSTTVAPTPEQAQVEEYLTALADGRYDDAARVLNEGGLEPERRADLRPLYTEYGDVDDLAARLQSWCEDIADCSAPDAAPVDIGGYWVASWSGVTGYFRSGSFEGSASVHGLPPRRPPAGALTACPTSNVDAVREGDFDVDGHPETVVLTHQPDATADAVWLCNTSMSIPLLQMSHSDGRVLGILQPAEDPTLVIGISGESGVCGSMFRVAASAGAFVQVGWQGCWGANTGESFGCRDIDGVPTNVAYRYSFVGGDRLDNSTAMNVQVLTPEGAPLDSFTLTLPDEIDQGFQIVEPYCNGLPVMTEG